MNSLRIKLRRFHAEEAPRSHHLYIIQFLIKFFGVKGLNTCQREASSLHPFWLNTCQQKSKCFDVRWRFSFALLQKTNSCTTWATCQPCCSQWRTEWHIGAFSRGAQGFPALTQVLNHRRRRSRDSTGMKKSTKPRETIYRTNPKNIEPYGIIWDCFIEPYGTNPTIKKTRLGPQRTWIYHDLPS